MLIAAVDTTTRVGSVALVRDDRVVASFSGEAATPHAERLPGDLTALLASHRLSLADVDVFAVATGPGSFTGLRIGIAAVQGLAFALGKLVVAVSALEALATAVAAEDPGGHPVGVWMDARRHEVFSAAFQPERGHDDSVLPSLGCLEEAAVGLPALTLDRWCQMPWFSALRWVGDGTAVYRQLLAGRLVSGAASSAQAPAIAPWVGRIGARRAAAGQAVHPHAIQPIYVRRPDVELARARRQASG